MKPQIPWLRVFVEGVVIVGSILLAFGIQAWWDERQEREEEQLLLGSLLVEFQANRPALEQTIDRHRRLATYAGEVLELVSASGEDEVVVPDSLLLGLAVSTTYNPTLGALAEAQNSGRTALIRNQALRALLGAWPGRLEDALEGQEDAHGLWRDNYYEVLGNHVSLADLMPGPELRSFLDGQPSASRGASRRIPVTPAMENYAAQRRRALGASATQLTDLRVQLDSILGLLHIELAQ